MNRKWIALGLAFAGGIAVGVAGSWTWLEMRANEKFHQWVSLREGTEAHLAKLRAERKPAETVSEEMRADLAEQERLAMPYVPSVTAYNASPEFELISEDEFRADNGMDKITIEVFRDDLNYTLVVDGDTVIDWKDYLIPSVLEDLKGQTSLFLRNNKKDEEYEVTWGQP